MYTDRYFKILNLLSEGKTYKEISILLHISRQRVQQIIKPSMEVTIMIDKRCNDKCEICGDVTNQGVYHHRFNEFGESFNMNNPDCYLYLCKSCHTKLHHGSNLEDFVKNPNGLSKRETQVYLLLAKNYKNKDVAQQLGISIRTAEIHRANILRKLGLAEHINKIRQHAITNGVQL